MNGAKKVRLCVHCWMPNFSPSSLLRRCPCRFFHVPKDQPHEPHLMSTFAFLACGLLSSCPPLLFSPYTSTARGTCLQCPAQEMHTCVVTSRMQVPHLPSQGPVPQREEPFSVLHTVSILNITGSCSVHSGSWFLCSAQTARRRYSGACDWQWQPTILNCCVAFHW